MDEPRDEVHGKCETPLGKAEVDAKGEATSRWFALGMGIGVGIGCVLVLFPPTAPAGAAVLTGAAGTKVALSAAKIVTLFA